MIFQLSVQTLIFIFASAFILQFITKRERKKLVYVLAFTFLVMTNYFLVNNLIELYKVVVTEMPR